MSVEKAVTQNYSSSRPCSLNTRPFTILGDKLSNDRRDLEKNSDALGEKSTQVNDSPSLCASDPIVLPIDITRGDNEFIEGGWQGWLVVIGCFLIGAPTVGWNLIWGVFQAYHSAHLLRETPDATLSLIGASQNAGVLQGAGCGLTLPMVFALPSQWFKQYRGLATGIVIAGAALGGAVSSLVIQAMLLRMSLQMTLLIYAFAQGGIMFVGCFLVKVRPLASHITGPIHKRIKWVDTVYFKDPVFWSCWFALALFVLDELFKRGRAYNVGLLADQIGFVNALILTATISAFSQAVLWNVTTYTYVGVITFSIIFGLTGPCYVSLTPPIATTLYGMQSLASLTGLLNIASLPGAFSGPPIGGYILKASGRNWHALAGYSGAVQFAGVLCILYARFKREPKILACL
ncbi:major facilitator superfamily transporter [Rhizoctonia solani]|uniref:Major facilitator superfamily transporter n=1 Tax=Rhizoctonia solani TaxID=456999 RepID=A0A8H8SWR1_9AGAM|nr:major facilitator superfamily transporter [Rhizoctonia solani]QRW20799.1 major facilitator superfamily transporter [Rhizoctonia solani]